MRKTLVVALCALAAACGGGSEPQQATFRLVAPETEVALLAGEVRVIQLMVVGAGAEPAVLTGEMPTFARLDGSLLTIAPSRADEGSYLVELVATAGSNVATAAFTVQVTRYNTRPVVHDELMWDEAGTYVNSGVCFDWTEPEPDYSSCCPGPSCRVVNPPGILAVVSDAEGDAVVMDVEVVPLGGAFAGVPTHSSTWLPPRDGSDSVYGKFRLDGLAPDTAYQFALRLADAWGAAGAWRYDASAPPDADGWVRHETFRFTTRP